MEMTTAEKARKQSHIDLTENLQDILEKNYDAEHGYKEAMLRADKPSLKEYLKERAVMRNLFATEISDLILKLNETPRENGSATGTIHRAWMNLKDALSFDTDEAILEECIRGDKASVKEYKEFLEDTTLPTDITSIITRQLLKVEKSLEEIKSLENLA